MDGDSTHTFDTPGAVTLEIRIPSGLVSIETIDEPRTDVDLVPRGRKGEDAIAQIDVSHDERGGRHVVSIEQRDRIRWGPLQISWGGDVEVRVRCPVGAELVFNGASADIRAEGRYGRVSARTASGDVFVGDVDGKLEVKTASGDVRLVQVESDEASLVTVSGDVEIGTNSGRLALRTVSGDVELGVARGPVTISTTSGDVDLRSLEAGELRIQSVSGDAHVGIGRGTKIFVDAVSVSGELNSELAVGDERPAAEGEGDESGSADVVPVHVKTVSGNVRLVRAS
jgi:hypothetical protein